MSSNISEILFDTDARSKMIQGVDTLANAVKITLGPKGKNVAIYRPGTFPHLTKDGVTVASVINLRDPFQNLGVQLVKEAAQRSAEIAGDGTTTSTVLAQQILHEGKKFADSGTDIRQFCAGIENAAVDLLSELEKNRIDIKTKKELIDVATISANGESIIGNLIADAIERVTEDGAISVEKARGFDTELEIVEGTVVDRGYLSPYFVTDQARGLAEFDNAVVFIFNSNLTMAKEILPVLEYTAKMDASLLIVANDVTSEALQTLVLNKLKGALRVCAIKAPEFGPARTVALQDLAALTGGEVVATFDSNLSENIESVLGKADKVIVTKHSTLFVGVDSNCDAVEERCQQAQGTLSNPLSDQSDVAIAQRRLRRMSDGVAVIKVGGATEVEMLERKDRIEDAMYAARAAKKGGIQPGGGTAILAASKKLRPPRRSVHDAYASGYRVLLDACRGPLFQIIKNSGEIPEIIVRKVEK